MKALVAIWLPPVLAGVWFRAIPFVAYSLLSARVGRAGKGAALTTLALLVFAGPYCWWEHARLFLDGALGWAYLSIGALLVHRIARWWAQVDLTFAGALLGAGTIFLFVPALLFRNSATMLLLSAGLEIGLSAFSYWRESSRAGPEARSLAECVRFLLVDPTVVFPTRGRVLLEQRVPLHAAWRVALGTSSMFVSAAMVSSLAWLSSYAARWADPGAGLVLATGTFVAQLCVVYVSHVGLAHFQIGAMRLVGYEVPERYRAPYLAQSPEDFWRRWNTYVGAWLQRYAYLPLAARYQRGIPPRRWAFAKGCALVSTFTLCGLLHEAAGYALRFALPVGAVVAFTLYGAALAAWLALRGPITRAARAFAPHPHRALTAAAATVSWGLATSVVLAFGSLLMPALEGRGLHPQLVRWILP